MEAMNGKGSQKFWCYAPFTQTAMSKIAIINWIVFIFPHFLKTKFYLSEIQSRLPFKFISAILLCTCNKLKQLDLDSRFKELNSHSKLDMTYGMWFLTSCHLQANLWSKFYLYLSNVIFMQKSCLEWSKLCVRDQKNRLMLKTKACENVP